MQPKGIDLATVLPIEIVDRPGILELQLFYDNEADYTASLLVAVRPEQQVARTLHVLGYSRMDIATALNDDTVGFVKIYVEQAELEVLCTIEPLLKALRPWMLIEILPAYRVDYSGRLNRQTEIETLLTRQGYTLLRVKKDNAGKTLTHLQQIKTFGVHENIDDRDYLVVPETEVEQVVACGLEVVAAA